MLTTEAFNTLLKTLEEPPENVIFILATTEPHKVLDTIISRCQRFDFRRITTDDIVSRLKYICEQEKIKITEDALFTIARSSQGGMRDSLALLDQISVLDADKEITSDDVNEMLGRLSFDVLFELTNNILASNTQEALNILDKVYNKGNEPFQIVSNLIQYFRNLLIVKNCSDRKIAAELTQLAESHILNLKEQGENIQPEQMLYVIERLSFYSKEIKETTNRYLWLELCIIELSSNVKYSSYSALLERIEKLEAQVSSDSYSVSADRPLTVFKIPELKKENIPPKQDSEPSIAKQEPQVNTNLIENNNKEQLNNNSENVENVEIDNSSMNALSNSISSSQSDNNSDTDIMSAWQGILQNIDSIPSRMFFYNLSRPVSLTKDGIEIAFLKDIFVKQAKEESKNAPLKKAALKYFGVDDINIHIKLVNTNEISSTKPSLDKLEKKAPVQNSAPQSTEIEDENAILLENELHPISDTAKKNEANVNIDNLSDKSKMVMELFNGKYIE